MGYKEKLSELLSTTKPEELNSVKGVVSSLTRQYPELNEPETNTMMVYCGLKYGVNSLMDVKKRVYDVGDDGNEEHNILNGLTAKYISSDPQGNLLFFKTSLTTLIKNEERIKPHYVLSQDQPRMVNGKNGQVAVKSIHFWVDGEIRDITLWGNAVDNTYNFLTGHTYKMVTIPAREGGFYIDTTLSPMPTTDAPPDLTQLVDYIVKHVPEAIPPFSVLSNIKSYYIVGQLLDLGGQFSIMNNYTKALNGTLVLFNNQRLPLKNAQKFIAVGKFSKKKDAQDDYYFYPDVFIDSRDGIMMGNTNTTNTPNNTTPNNNATDPKNMY